MNEIVYFFFVQISQKISKQELKKMNVIPEREPEHWVDRENEYPSPEIQSSQHSEMFDETLTNMEPKNKYDGSWSFVDKYGT